MIDIVCSIDENYIEYCGVMLASLFVHTPNEKFRVHIICSSKVEKAGKKRLKVFAKNIKLKFIFMT